MSQPDHQQKRQRQYRAPVAPPQWGPPQPQPRPHFQPRPPQPPFQYQKPQPPQRPRQSRKGLAFLGCGGLGALAVLIAILVSSNSGSSPSAAVASSPGATGTAVPAKACKLKTTFDYIVRDDDPGASVMAQEIGNVDIVNCADSLSDFQATSGQAPGECTTIALASKNPGYDVNKVPAPPLKDVIESAGPGC